MFTEHLSPLEKPGWGDDFLEYRDSAAFREFEKSLEFELAVLEDRWAIPGGNETSQRGRSVFWQVSSRSSSGHPNKPR